MVPNRMAALALSVLQLVCRAAPGVSQADSQNVFGAALGKCDRPGYFAANPEQRDTKHPVTGYFRNNEVSCSRRRSSCHRRCLLPPPPPPPPGPPPQAPPGL